MVAGVEELGKNWWLFVVLGLACIVTGVLFAVTMIVRGGLAIHLGLRLPRVSRHPQAPPARAALA